MLMKTILLVDDDTPLMKMYVQALEEKGLKIVHKTSADEALEFAANDPGHVDILVLDLMMDPGEAFKDKETFGGLATGFFLRNSMRQYYSKQPIIFLTNLNLTEILTHFALGPHERLEHKFNHGPFDFAKLVCDILQGAESGSDSN